MALYLTLLATTWIAASCTPLLYKVFCKKLGWAEPQLLGAQHGMLTAQT